MEGREKYGRVNAASDGTVILARSVSVRSRFNVVAGDVVVPATSTLATVTSTEPRLVNRSLTSNACPGITGAIVGGGGEGRKRTGRFRQTCGLCDRHEVDAERGVDRIRELLLLHLQDLYGIRVGSELLHGAASGGEPARQRRNGG